MALTYTPQGQLGSTCPDFTLPTVEGHHTVNRAEYMRMHPKALVVMFICNHCPYVRAIEDRLLALAFEFSLQGVGFLGICSNDDRDNPEDSPQALLARWREKSYSFPYLIDVDQKVARALGAVCTPDLYIFDATEKLRYRGRLDDSWKNPALVQRQELKEALQALLLGQAIPEPQNPSMGCSIKWKKG